MVVVVESEFSDRLWLSFSLALAKLNNMKLDQLGIFCVQFSGARSSIGAMNWIQLLWVDLIYLESFIYFLTDCL